MMRRAGADDQLEEVFDALKMSADEKFAAAAFFHKEAGEETLKEIPFLDLSVLSPDELEKVEKFAEKLVRKKQMGELARLFLLVFARGESTCHPIFSEDYLRLIAQAQGVERAKVVAVYGSKAGRNPYPNIYSVQSVFDIAKSSTKTLRQALPFLKHDPGSGRLILLALYFRIEYQNRKPYALGRRDVDGSPLPVTEVEAEDAPLFAEYERLATEGLAELFFGCVGQSVTGEAVAELSKDLGEGRIPKVLAPLIGAQPNVDERLHKLTAGLSYWNYMLSEKLKNIVKLCFAIHGAKTFELLSVMSNGTTMDIAKKGGNYDEVFGIGTEDYLRWAVRWNYKEILKKQLKTHRECYLNLMDTIDIVYSANLLAVIKEEDGALYEEIIQKKKQRMEQGDNPDREKIIAELVKGVPNRDRAFAYLRGESKVNTIYRGNKLAGIKRASFGLLERWHFDNYMKCYKDEAFLRRCEAYALLNNGMDFFKVGFIGSKDGSEYIMPEKVEKIWADLEAEGVGLKWQFAGVIQTYKSLRTGFQEKFFQVAAKIFAGYFRERKKELTAVFHGASSLDPSGRLFALEVFRQNAGENKEEILGYLQDSAKPVREKLFEIFCGQKVFEEDVKGLLASKQAAERELAVRVLCFWQGAGADYREMFVQAFAKERSAKVKGLLAQALTAQEMGTDGAGAFGVGALRMGTSGAKVSGVQNPGMKIPNMRALDRPELVKAIHKGGKGRGLAWAYTEPFSAVHFLEEGKAVADEKYLQAIFLCYSSTDHYGINKNAAYLAEVLDAAEFAVYVNELFDRWMAAGAEAKKKWVLYAAAIHGGNRIIGELYCQIKEWPARGRGAIACEAVRALSLNPLPQALLFVDGIARKFKFRQVKAAAGEALEFAAVQLGMTREELSDRLVPDFGFDGKCERMFDYGTRTFIVTITPTLALEVFEAVDLPQEALGVAGGARGDGNGCNAPDTKTMHVTARGKSLKTLPAPGKKDDEKKAAAAYEEFKQMKKQLKATVDGQKQRLEMVLLTARKWNISAWERLFVKNPVMRPFANGLIWGLYQDGKLVQSFRYMEDGTFNTADEEELELPSDPDGSVNRNMAGKEAGKISESENSSVRKEENVTVQMKIGLVHPIELIAEELAAWRRQLADYEITQPFGQLGRAVYTVAWEEADTRELTRFADQQVNGLTLCGRLLAFGWQKGVVGKGGYFDTYYREDLEMGFNVTLHFSGSYAGDENEEVTIYGVRFYKEETVGEDIFCGEQCASSKENMSEQHGKKEEKEGCILREVPARYFSEVVWQVAKAAGNMV